MTPTKQDASAALPDESQGWRPSEGDVVSGAVVAVSRAWSDWTQSHYPLVTIHDETTDKDVDVHAFHEVLRARLMETKPKIGDKLSIIYLGQRATKDGKRQVSLYRVDVPGADGTEVWDALERQPSNAAATARTDVPAPDDDDIPF